VKLARTHPRDWTAEQRAEWIAAWLNDKPGLLPVPLHPRGECEFCEIFYGLMVEAARTREVKHA
jgi:hypothetical protein